MVAQKYLVHGALDLDKSDEVVCRRDRTACHGAIELMPVRCRDRAGVDNFADNGRRTCVYNVDRSIIIGDPRANPSLSEVCFEKEKPTQRPA